MMLIRGLAIYSKSKAVLVRVMGKRWKNVVFGLRAVVSALRSVWSQIEAIIIHNNN